MHDLPRLTEMELQLVRALVEAGEYGLRGLQLADKTGWYWPDGLPMTTNCVHQHVFNLRLKGVPIRSSRGTWGRYWFERETAARFAGLFPPENVKRRA